MKIPCYCSKCEYNDYGVCDISNIVIINKNGECKNMIEHQGRHIRAFVKSIDTWYNKRKEMGLN